MSKPKHNPSPGIDPRWHDVFALQKQLYKQKRPETEHPPGHFDDALWAECAEKARREVFGD